MTKIAKLTNSLRERIHSGEWSDSLPSRMLLSEEYGVAPGTISQVFRNLEQEGLVRILPRKGVLITETTPAPAAAPTEAAIGLRGSYLHMGVPGKEGYTGFIVNQLLDAAHKRGVPIMILQKRDGEGLLTRERCESLGLRGIIYLGGDCSDEARELCTEGFPVISGNRALERSPVNYIDCDHVALIRDAVRRYAELGHRRIAVILPPTHVPGLLDKLKPHFIDALLSNGIQYDINPYWISFSKEEDRDDRARRIEALLDSKEPPTGILCWSHVITNLLISLIARRGMQVPCDISVAYTPCSSAIIPGVSGFSYETQDFGGKLLENLLATIENPFHFVQDELPFEFIDNGSIAPPPPGSIPS